MGRRPEANEEPRCDPSTRAHASTVVDESADDRASGLVLGSRARLAVAVVVAAACGSAFAAIVVSHASNARGALSDNGVAVDGGGSTDDGRVPLLRAVRHDVLGRKRCPAPTARECADPAWLATDCGQREWKALTQTRQSSCSAFCTTPTLAQCQSEDFVRTMCGQIDVVAGRVAIPAGCVDEDLFTECPSSPSTCQNLLRDAGAELQARQGTVVPGVASTTIVVPSSVVLPPDHTPEERAAIEANGYADPSLTTTAPRLEPDWSDMTTTPPGSSYFARQTQDAVATKARNPTALQQVMAATRAAERQAWNANGNVVAECAEYVYEKYYDYSVFEDALRTPGQTPRGVWNVAYADAGFDSAIGTHGALAEFVGGSLVLRQKDDTALPVEFGFPDEPQPKNEFFATPIVSDAARAQALADFAAHGGVANNALALGAVESQLTLPRPVFGILGIEGIVLLDDDLHARLRDTPPVDENWTYHRDLGTQLGPETDEEMLALEQERQAFVPLLTRWTERADEVNTILRDLLPDGGVLVDGRPFDPGVFENVVTSSQVPAVRALVDVHGAANLERASLLGASSSPSSSSSSSSGLLGGAVMSSSLGGSSLAQTLRMVTGPMGAATPMSAPFGGTQARLTAVAATHSTVVVGQLRPAVADGETRIDRLKAALLDLAIVSGEIEAALIAARDRACLEPTTTTCDWSPRRFLQRVNDQFQTERERDFQRCLRMTGDDFAKYRLNQNDPGRFLVTLSSSTPPPRTEAPPADNVVGFESACDDARYDTSPTRFERWMRCHKHWRVDMLQALEETLVGAGELVDPETGRIEPSETSGDVSRTGDDMFAMGFEYAAEWRLTGLPVHDPNQPPSPEQWCSLEPQAHGFAQADGKLLGFDFELAEARADIDTRDGRGKDNRAYIEIGGEEILSVKSADGSIDISTYNLIFEEGTYDSYELFSFKQSFPVGPVWIGISAGATGSFGARLHGAVGRLPGNTEGCGSGDLGLEAELRPALRFTGFAAASLDFLIVSAGVKITLTLVELNLPFTVRLTFEGNRGVGNDVDVRMVVTNNLDMALRLLDGRVSAFVEVCFLFCEDFEATLFDWDGLRFVVNLFHTELEIPLGTLAEFQSQAEAAFAPSP